ncbi:Golgin imh1 [Teratosphaeriaceae sp. CCFEE 6253]|nr:Golgin imh1 [Teratosphaeriaceae sp. CCFEE 6253]
MFNRLKGFNLDSFLDSKIAEEQAKQGKPSQSPTPAKRTPSNAGPRRSSARTDSPARRGGSRLRVADGGDAAATGKGPDPEEFVIGDDASDISRAATPRPTKEGADGPSTEDGKGEAGTEDGPAGSNGKERVDGDELPEEVRRKLAKLDSLNTKYSDLLRNYRTAHARVSSIEPFEATLREHTPLTSIAEPGALVEFLNQRSLQSDMVLQELKRISGEHNDLVKERDELKVKLGDAEKQAREAHDEAAGLREQREQAVGDKKSTNPDFDPLGVNGVSHEEDDTIKPVEDDDEFFSYDAEQKRNLDQEMKQHLEEIQEQKAYINELSTENATLRKDFDMCELNLKAMENKVGVKENHLRQATGERDEAREQLEAAGKAREEAQEQEQEGAALLAQTEGQVLQLQDMLKEYQQSLKDRERELKEKAALAEENLKKYQAEHAENLKSGTYAQRDEKGMESLRNLVKTLREQTAQAHKDKEETEGRANNLRLQISMLESEASSRATALVKAREGEATAESYKRKMESAEHDRDEAHRVAETKKGHEAAAASLRSQLKTAIKDRDDAYQMIIDCGKCKIPGEEATKQPQTPTESSNTPEARSRGLSETTEHTEASTQPTEVSTPSINGDPETADAKKKNKKKKPKTKKKLITDILTPIETSEVAAPSIDELIAQPEKAKELLNKGGADREIMAAFIKRSIEKVRQETESQDEEREGVIRHHEQAIEDRDQTIRDLQARIAQQEAMIELLQGKLKEEGALQEEIEALKESLIEMGAQATDAKHELKTVREQKLKLQEEFDDLQVESDTNTKSFKDAEAQRLDLAARCKTLETEMMEMHTSYKAASTLAAGVLRAAWDQVAGLEEEKSRSVQAVQQTLEETKAQHSASSAEDGAKYTSLSADFDGLKAQAASLEKDLAAAGELAQTRFKDLTDLRAHLNTLQPELKKLREGSAELSVTKADLEKVYASLKRLESKEKDLRSEIKEYKSQAAAKDSELASLKDVAKQSDERSSALEDSYENARKDLEQSQSKRDEATDARDKLQADLKKTEEVLRRSTSSLDELEKQVSKLRAELDGVRDELQVKSAQSASAQTLMDSQQNQSRELAIQMREIRERNESLEEELADAHRLLSERSREGETMRRMLSEVEARVESRVKEMRERMDLAIEERDRAEDEANSAGRRRAREVEDLKTKLKDAEKEAAHATEAREGVEERERQFKDRRDELETRAKQAQEELAEVRSAMAQLRATLDESERQTGALEKEKAELRKEIEDRQARLEKMQKSTKTMSEELRGLQTTNKLRQGSVQSSSRSSLESTPVASPRITSPPPRGSGGTPSSRGSSGTENIDYRYLKNVLLQFLEQKEKKHQMQLVPVLGMLLQFDKQDQQKWEAVVAARLSTTDFPTWMGRPPFELPTYKPHNVAKAPLPEGELQPVPEQQDVRMPASEQQTAWALLAA